VGGAAHATDELPQPAYALGTLALIVVIQRIFKAFWPRRGLVGLVWDRVAGRWGRHLGAVGESARFGGPRLSLRDAEVHRRGSSRFVSMLDHRRGDDGDVFATGEIVDRRIGRADIPGAARGGLPR